MTELIEERFREWTQGRDATDARVSIYERIRDIPYAVIPELIDAQRYVEILKLGKGSCTPKHFLLCNMYQRLEMVVLYVVYPFRWDEFEIDYPPRLKKLAEALPTSYHLALIYNPDPVGEKICLIYDGELRLIVLHDGEEDATKRR